MLCRHCNRKRSNRPRGLCWVCYHTPDVCARYPAQHKLVCSRCGIYQPNRRTGLCPYCAGVWKVPDRVVEAQKLLPTVGTGPSRAVPCSAERLALLIRRQEAGLPLWNREDRFGEED